MSTFRITPSGVTETSSGAVQQLTNTSTTRTNARRQVRTNCHCGVTNGSTKAWIASRPFVTGHRRCGPTLVRCSSSKEAELKKMEEFRQGLGKRLEQQSASPSAAASSAKAGASGDERDLEEVDMDSYWEVVKSLSADDKLVVMDFYTQWCGPCKLMKPTLCDWAEELDGKVSFRKFEASKKNAPLGKELQVKSVPTLIVYKNGEEIGRVVGKKEEQLRAMIDENM